jgi:hypothetical protein
MKYLTIFLCLSVLSLLRAQPNTVAAHDGTVFPAPPRLVATDGAELEISGQVFITTNGGGTVKLGGIRVSVYSKRDFDAQLAWANRFPDKHAKAVYAAGDVEKALYLRARQWDMFHPARFIAETDADGAFVLRHKVSGPFVIVARAEREVGGEPEFFKWAVPSESIKDPKRVLLSSNNVWKRPASMQ